MPLLPQIVSAAVAALLTTSALALTAQEERTEKDRIAAAYQAAKQQCKSLQGHAQDVCEEEAKGQEKIAKAELDLRKDPSDKHRYELAKTKADAAYEVAKERCDALKGNAEDVCEKDAKAAHVKALEAAKVNRVRDDGSASGAAKAADVAEARKEAAEHVREAEYKAAVQRCDSLSGDAKDACQSDAKRQFAQ